MRRLHLAVFVGLAILSLAVAAYARAQAEEPPPTGGEAEAAAIAFLAGTRGLTAEQISVISVEEAEWTDSCLGLGGPAESCLQATTPGYRIVLGATGLKYEARTNADGSAVRIK